MEDDLPASINNAYRVFSPYRLKGAVSVCSCRVCVDQATGRQLCTVPLRQMSSQLLAEYTHSAHGLDDRAADEFRHFLPRYFELMAAGDAPSHIGIETCLDRLCEADYRHHWPPSEAGAIDRFLVALFRARLADPPIIDSSGLPTLEGSEVEDTLCMVANAGGDLTRLLAAWDADRSRTATLHIANIIGIADWLHRNLRNSFWRGERRPHAVAGMRQVVEWLLRDATRALLEAACLTEMDPGAAALLSHAEGIVGAMMVSDPP